jgi:hypothetical protein
MPMYCNRFVTVMCIAIAIGAPAGCERVPTAAKSSVYRPEEPSKPARTTKLRKSSWVKNCYPGGNETTLQYFRAANERHQDYAYCDAILDENGDCKELHLNVCYQPDSVDLNDMLLLPKLQTVSMKGESLTDEQLVFFARMPSLKKLSIYLVHKLTTHGIERLKMARPDLEVAVTFSRQRSGDL